MFGLLLLIVLLFAVLILIPFVLGRYFGIWVGLFAALAAIPAWVYLGPRPSPGFGSGIVCLLGLAGLIGVLIAWIVKAIHHVVA